MIALMNENDLMELEVEKEGLKVRIKKSPQGMEEFPRPESSGYQTEVLSSAKTQESLSPQSSTASIRTPILSPMVGTFYRAPSPEAPPFVEMGQVVEVGQVVCIIEAMKLMNEIKSEVKGRIIECAVENAEPVEFGQTLFVVEPV